MEKYVFEYEMAVRDYECDMQGIVNNANYQHYLEHTRHEFLRAVGKSFTEMRTEGIDPVVSRITIDYKQPLRSGDVFTSKLYIRREGIKFVFFQHIFRLSDQVLCVRAKVETVCLVMGKVSRGDELLPAFGNYLQ